MDEIDTHRRAFLGLLTATLAVGAGAALPIKVRADIESGNWPLWAIRRGSKAIYLTAETPPRPTDWYDARIERALTHCSEIWTETNNVYKLDPKVLVSRYGIDPKRPLTSWLDANDKARLARAAASCNIALADLAPYRPWFVGATLQETFYQTAGWKGKSAREFLTNRAAKARISAHSEFKDKDDVFAWFGALTPLQDVQFLRYVFDEVLAGPAADTTIFNAWAEGQLGPATAEVKRYSRSYPELAQQLTFKRNQQWLLRFERMFTSAGMALVIVGLYHIVGPSGILSLAGRNGLMVERL